MTDGMTTPETLREFAVDLAQSVRAGGIGCDPSAPWRLLIDNGADRALLDLTPVLARPAAPDAAPFFAGVRDVQDLLDGYAAARRARVFEDDLEYLHGQVHGHATDYLGCLLEQAHSDLSAGDAARIARLVVRLDVYVAVKSVESLLVSRADRLLLQLADKHQWQLHFDHLAIRAGTAERRDAERVAALLRERHGYVAPQADGERVYRFADGWNALPQYKLLANGEMLRIFVDQSDGSNPRQIIRHWNRAYGFTAHHLAIRATRQVSGVPEAVPLAELTGHMEDAGTDVLTATGGYTQGLLEQVFTCPSRQVSLPDDLAVEFEPFGVDDVVRNGKLLELITRREMSTGYAARCLRLWGLDYDPARHSVPVFGYFLPAQAAHVIRTSVAA